MTSVLQEDVPISFLILLIFSEKKEANSLHLLSESISLGSTWGFVNLSTVAKRVRVLFKLLFIRFEKKVCLAVASSKFESMKAVFIDAIVYFKFRLPPHPAQLFCIVFSYSELLLIFSKMIFVCHSSC